MVSGDSIIGIIIIGAFFFLIGSRVYKHEKEHIDPMISKIKSWFSKEENEGDSNYSMNQDYELDFIGQIK